MDRTYDEYRSYSWHQSHDQATVLLLVPYDTVEEDISVLFERNFLVAGVKGQPPIVKGRLYGSVDVTNSSWQLEPRASSFSARERTTSTTSTASTQSSFAVVSETEVSSSFAASVEGLVSDYDDTAYLSSPALSSPISLSEDPNGFPLTTMPRRQPRFTTSHPVSPHTVNPPLSLTSSYSSLESLHGDSGRLLTLHLEKAESVIWPSLVVGPVPEALSPCNTSVYPWHLHISSAIEAKYNMDPTSLVLIALELCDIRNDKEEAFEYFVRAWHQAHVPSATTRLAAHYLPVTAVPLELLLSTSTKTPTSESSPPPPPGSPGTTPTSSHVRPPLFASTDSSSSSLSSYSSASPQTPVPGSLSYYLHHVGGAQQLAQLYLENGLLHLEGTASTLLNSSYAGLASLRTPTLSASIASSGGAASNFGFGPNPGVGVTDGSEVWRRDQERARRYFDRARDLCPGLDVPLLPIEEGGVATNAGSGQLVMPTIDLPKESEKHQGSDAQEKQMYRRRTAAKAASTASSRRSTAAKEDSATVVNGAAEDDHTWYLYLPGLVGAGTALLVVGFLSFSSWRKSQTS